MNDPSIIQPPSPLGGGNWVDAYMPEGKLEQFQKPPRLINLAIIRGILFRQRWLIAAAIVTSLAIGVAITLLATPMYEATARIAYEPYGANIVEGQDVNRATAGREMINYLGTQGELIRSRSMAEVVVDDLKLADRYDVLGKDIDESRKPNMSDAQWRAAKREIAISKLANSVSAEVPVKNWVITIGFRSGSPALAAELANAYADAVVASGSRDNIRDNQYALDYLREQIELVSARLKIAEEASNDYARANGIIVQSTATEEGGARTLITTNLVNINQRVSEVRAARIEAEQRWRAVSSVPASQLPEAQSNATLLALTAERSTKANQLVELRQRYNDDFPQIASLLAQLRQVDAEIARASASLRESFKTQYLIALKQEQALDAELRGLTNDTLVEQDERVQLSVLEREAEAMRTQLKTLLDRYNQVNSAADIDRGNINKIDSATIPRAPYSPDITRNMLLALVLGVALAGVLAALRETLDDRVRSLDDIEEKLGLTLLGHTPHVDGDDMATEGTNKFSALMEAYASIRAGIDFSLPRDRNVLQLTSTKAGEGKSTTSVIVAELSAALGRKTLLIDADLRRPSVARLLNIERPKFGLVEVLLGHVRLEDALVKGVHENLDILPVGEIPPNPSEIFALPEMAQFIAQCRQDYALVVFDSCPVMGLADGPMLANMVDATIFVLEANKVPFGQARSAIKRLQSPRSNLLGVIVTKYKALDAGESYDYQYGYYKYGSDRV